MRLRKLGSFYSVSNLLTRFPSFSKLNFVGNMPPNAVDSRSGLKKFKLKTKKMDAEKGETYGANSAWYSVPEIRLVNAVSPSSVQLKAPPQPLNVYLSLSKSRLTSLVVTSAMAGYVVAPETFSIVDFALMSSGIAFISASANTINQIIEIPYDSLMKRTMNRALVKDFISKPQAWSYAITSGVVGLVLLTYGLNPLTGALGFSNLLLYTSVYTPMKRKSILNTWVGSVVGALPPVIGWVGCTNSISVEAFVLFGILFCWQFPHFNALSWNIATDYQKAGYKMMSHVKPNLCKSTTIHYSVLLTLGCLTTPWFCPSLTSWSFAADSLVINSIFVYLSYRFYKDGDATSARNLFRYSLFHLPILMLLLIINNQLVKRSKVKQLNGCYSVKFAEEKQIHSYEEVDLNINSHELL